MILQPVVDIAEICYRKGIRQAIICPGSRNAPLTLAFARHGGIACYSMSDERSAAFTGMGMALKSNTPVVLICTSGSAAYNFAPAVAEAYFSHIPLVVLTADRPPEWIDQLDGQTIHQKQIFGSHVKKSFQFPDQYAHQDVVWHCHRMVNEAINTAEEFPKGPTHINIPLREPFYPEDDEQIAYTEALPNIQIDEFAPAIGCISPMDEYPKIILVCGQHQYDRALQEALLPLSVRIPVVADIISNMHGVPEAITTQDAFLKNKANYDDLKPDLVISFGKSVISKNLKIFLRQTQPTAHWHIQPAGDVADTFQCLSKIIRCDPTTFLTRLASEKSFSPAGSFWSLWQNEHKKTVAALRKNIDESEAFSEFKAFETILSALPDRSDIHLANSMAVRYANFIGLQSKKDVEVYANRGTSGIDGSTSTAVGTALLTDRPTFLLTGDVAFFYDRNSLWHQHNPDNLKIVLFNNHGGGIFRMIDGPARQPELETFFETQQSLDGSSFAKEFNIGYCSCHTLEELQKGIDSCVNSKGSFLLEIKTDSKTNKQVYREVIGVLSQFN